MVGPLIGYEVLTAFFLEATFLGVMLFGWNRVPPWLHVLSTIVGRRSAPLISAFWILAANSWMQTPVGHEIKDGIVVPVDWLAIVFNPSFPYRFAHMVTAAYLTTSFVVLAVGARYLLAGRHLEEARTMLRMAVGFIAIVAPLQVLIGDLHGLNTAKHQPIKIAAMEAHWDGSKPGDFHIVRLAEREGRAQRLRHLDPQGRVAAHHARSERAVPRPQERAAERPAARAARVLRLPPDGAHRLRHGGDGLGGRLAVVARPAVRDAPGSCGRRPTSGGRASWR